MDIFILEPITQSLAKEVVLDISKAKGEDVTVHIMSIGGDMLAGNAITAALSNSPSHVTTNVIGVAASMAAVISQAGDTRLIAPDATFLIHNGAMAQTGGRGTSTDHREAIETLEKLDNAMVRAFARTGLNEKDIREIMALDTLLTADEAIQLGFFDAYSEKVAAVAELNKTISEMSKLEELMAKVDTAAIALGIKKTEDEGKTKLVSELKDKLKAQVDQIIEEVPDDASGADLLTAEMVSREEFELFKAEVLALIEPLLGAVEEMPSTEETEVMVEEVTTAKLDNVLKAIKSKTQIPQATQHFEQPAVAEKQDWSVYEAKKKEIAEKNKR